MEGCSMLAARYRLLWSISRSGVDWEEVDSMGAACCACSGTDTALKAMSTEDSEVSSSSTIQQMPRNGLTYSDRFWLCLPIRTRSSSSR